MEQKNVCMCGLRAFNAVRDTQYVRNNLDSLEEIVWRYQGEEYESTYEKTTTTTNTKACFDDICLALKVHIDMLRRHLGQAGADCGLDATPALKKLGIFDKIDTALADPTVMYECRKRLEEAETILGVEIFGCT